MKSTLILLALGLFLLLEPFLRVWARAGAPWYLPYLFWGLLIVGTAALTRGEPSHDP